MKNLPEYDLLFTGGRIFGGSGWSDPVWLNGVLVIDGKIAATGDPPNLIEIHKSSSENTLREIALAGSLLLPGLCDGHLHLAVGGKTLELTNLSGMDKTQVKGSLRETAKRLGDKDKWLHAFNWDSSRCSLTADDLEKWLPDQLVVINQIDLHGGCVSHRVLNSIGINKLSPDPSGGRIGRDSNGKPNGLLYESAIDPVRMAVPDPTPDDIQKNILRGQDYLIQKGVTAVSEVLNPNTEDIYRELDKNGLLHLQVDAWQRFEEWDWKTPPTPSGNRFQLHTLKAFLDGSFGSRTASLNTPYEDQPQNCGTLFMSDRDLTDLVMSANNAGWKLALHAIGDKSVQQAIRVLGKLPHPDIGKHRIEHMQLLLPQDVSNFAKTDLTASIQPVHLIDDQLWLANAIGKSRTRDSSIWQSLYENGVTLVIGSDWPVASPDPLLNIHASINRCGFGRGPNLNDNPKEVLLPATAIRAASHGWAEAASLSHRRGSITVGLDADFTVVGGMPEVLTDWSRAVVEMTVCGGKLID